MNYDTRDRVLALAGVFQAATLVADIAHGRGLDEAAFRSTLESLLVENADTTAEVFGGEAGVRLGLLMTRDALDPARQRGQTEVLRYAFAIVQVERRFSKRRDLQQIVDTRMTRLRDQLAHFDILHETIVGAVASLYQDTISTLRQRIQVVGNAAALQDERNADRIRAALMGGVRAAVLWHQVGGRRWRLLLNRRAVQHTAGQLHAGLD
ncbi:MAG: high frequency lysogenization protein HflD [Pseudomonadales bacterium]|nr:high frequency lysogenization protein HflD [Pseudomonadales bacterium]